MSDENTKFHGLESLIEHYLTTDGVLSDGLSLTVHIPGQEPPHHSRRHGRTNLLHRATDSTNEESYKVVSELLKTNYAHIEAKNKDGQTAVHLASMKGKDDILRKLIEHGASVNMRDTAGNTPLHVRLGFGERFFLIKLFLVCLSEQFS